MSCKIPKKIHYCWFGGNPLPESAIKCIKSWKKFFPEYQIIEWNEDNYDVHKIPYIREAYEAKKYAFVSDYARFDILYHEGGVYFDTDVEVIKTFDDIISKGGFMGCEKDGVDENTSIAGSETIAVAPGLGLATEAGTELYQEILHYYETQHFLNNDGSYNQETVVTKTTNLLFQYGLKNIKGIQYISGVTIYPKDFFNPYSFDTHKLDITENSRSIHRYDASWKTKGEKRKEAFLRIIGEKNASRLVRIKNMLKGN